MNRFRLLNKYRKEKTEANKSAYKRDKFLCETIKKDHRVIILNRSNNSYISIEISAPQQAGGFIMKYSFGISNFTACR